MVRLLDTAINCLPFAEKKAASVPPEVANSSIIVSFPLPHLNRRDVRSVLGAEGSPRMKLICSRYRPAPVRTMHSSRPPGPLRVWQTAKLLPPQRYSVESP